MDQLLDRLMGGIDQLIEQPMSSLVPTPEELEEPPDPSLIPRWLVALLAIQLLALLLRDRRLKSTPTRWSAARAAGAALGAHAAARRRRSWLEAAASAPSWLFDIDSYSRGWSRPLGIIHKSTFAVRDPAESCAFCIKYLDCEEIDVPDPALIARGIRWVRLPGVRPNFAQRVARLLLARLGAAEPDFTSEFHFIPWAQDKDIGLMGGVDTNGDGIVSGDEMQPITQKFIASLIDAADEDMKVWSVYANTHVGWCVADLTPTVARLQRDGVPFFGPTQRADGVFQVYLELPYLHYLEVDSRRYDARVTGRPAKPWAEAVRESSVEGISRQYSLG